MDCGYLATVGDATQDLVLERLGIARARGVACLTASDSENIVITLSARELNPEALIVSRAEQEQAIRKIQRAGATRVISPVLTGGRRIAEAICNPNLTELLDSSRTKAGAIELVEVVVRAESKLDGAKVMDYGAEQPTLVFVAMKGNDGDIKLHPPGQHQLEAGDVLIIAGDQPSVAGARRDAGWLRTAA
jgi:voltage-gated potassium channel